MSLQLPVLLGLYAALVGVGLLWWALSSRGSRRTIISLVSILPIGGGLLLALHGLLRGQPVPLPAPAATRPPAVESGVAFPEDGDLTFGGTAGEVLVGLTLRPGKPGKNDLLVYLLPLAGIGAASEVQGQLFVNGEVLPWQPCGPTCRRTKQDLQGGERIEVQVAGESGGRAIFPVPALPTPDGARLVDTLQARMHALHTYRQDEVLGPVQPPVRTVSAYQAPDRLWVEASNGFQTVFIGNRRYQRPGPGRPWQVEEGGVPASVPLFVWDDTPIVAPRIVGRAELEGTQTQVLSFFELKGRLPVWFQLWVDDEGLVRRAEMRAQGHFMTHRYFDFDVPLMIEPPDA